MKVQDKNKKGTHIFFSRNGAMGGAKTDMPKKYFHRSQWLDSLLLC